MSEMTRFHLKLIDNLATLTTAQQTLATLGPAYASRIRETTFVVSFGVGTTAGVVTIESAAHKDYTGTWASLGTVTWANANAAQSVSITGVHLALRARISTTIVDGTVDVDVVGR